MAFKPDVAPEKKKRGPNKPKPEPIDVKQVLASLGYVHIPKLVAKPLSDLHPEGIIGIIEALKAFDGSETTYDQCSYIHIDDYERIRLEHNTEVWIVKILVEMEYGMPVEML